MLKWDWRADADNLQCEGLRRRAVFAATEPRTAQQILASTGSKVLLLQFLHSGSKADVEKEYRAGETTNCGSGGCNPADAADFEKLVAAAPAVKVGDTSTYIFTAHGFKLLANNRPIAEFNNPDLAARILSGFIGEHPPSTELRSALLGQAAD